jgi:hypothetical protein
MMPIAKTTLLLLFTILISNSLIAQNKVSGRIVDKNNQALGFVSVYVQGSTYGTLANENGEFYLNLPSGKTTIIVQHLGYIAQSNSIEITKDIELNYTLLEETFSIGEVVVKSGEDPSIPIIKKAIKNREQHLRNPNSYKAELYIKAMMRIVDAPKSFLGRDLGNMDGILDSTRQGIVYFSESISNVNYMPPNKYKEELISSKISGDANGISVNQFSYANFNFYNESIGFVRELISPIADVALQYYNYYLYETFKDQNGYTINKIKVKPKSAYTPCVNGFIYITDELSNIQSLDLIISGQAMKNALLDSITIKQVYVPSTKDKNSWNLITQSIGFKLKFLVFKSRGDFSYVFKNYDYENEFAKDFFNNEIFVVKDDAIKNDSSFWTNNRPISLTQEESKDYIRKDSISRVVNSPAYQDSMDRKNNKFKPVNILFGYNHSNSKNRSNWGIANPLNTIQFNAVQGTTIGLRPFYSKSNKDDFTVFNSFSEINYGFSDKTLKYNINLDYNYNIKSLSDIKMALGNDYFQYYEKGIVSENGNTFQSLVYKLNAAKLFQKKFVKLSSGKEVANGFYINLDSEYAHRNSVENTTNFSWFNKDKSYEPNYPNISISPFEDKIWKQSITLSWSPDQKYQTYPTYRSRFKSEWPTFYLYFDHVIKLSADFAKYSKLKINIIDNYVQVKRFGHLKYRIEAGKFLSKDNVNVIDYFHFRGINLLSAFSSPYLQTFKLQKGYNFSTTDDYGAVWLEHYFDGFINDKIPLLNKIGITGIWSVSMLKKKELTYIEPGIGIEGIKIGAFDIMRLDYFWGFTNGKLEDKGLRIGLSTFIENIFGRK